MTTTRPTQLKLKLTTKPDDAAVVYTVASYDLANVRRIVGLNLSTKEASIFADSCRADSLKPTGHAYRVEPM